MAMLDSTVANLALDTIRTDFDAPLAKVQWVATGYLIAFAVSLPLTGWLGRRFGQSRLWAASTLAFLVASVLCGLSGELDMLIAARCMQGFAAGLMVPAGQALLSSLVDRRQLGRLMGTVGFAVALGPALGPGFGGVLIEAMSWRWLFWINVPIASIALVAAHLMALRDQQSQQTRLDAKGLGLIGTGLPLLLYGAAEIGASGLAPVSLCAFGLGAFLTAGFFRHAPRSAAPLIDIRLFERPGFMLAVITAGLTGAAMYGGLLVFPLFLQHSLHQSPAEAGLMLLWMGLGSALALPSAGSLTDKRGAAAICFCGSVLLLIGTAPFAASLSFPTIGVAAMLFLRGFGLAFAQMPAMTAAYGAVAKSETGDAATLINISQRLGGALGAIAAVIVLEHGPTTFGVTPLQWAVLLLVAFALGPLVTSRGLEAKAWND